MNNIDFTAAFNKEPKEAVQFFRDKGYVITENWHELLDAAHAKAFTVAHCAKIDILQDIRTELHKSLKHGKTLEWFKKNIIPTLQKKGWWGIVKEETRDGAERNINLGNPRRLETIYRTNMQSAYQAARWQQQQEVKDTHPYLQYLAVMDSHTRPGHAAMHGRVFAQDDPIWNTCYPPNGFNCRCTVRAVSRSALKREGLEVEKAELDTVTLKAGKDKTAKVTSVKLKDKAGKPVVFHPDVGFNANMGKDWHREFTPPSEDGSPNAFPLIRTFERGGLPSQPSPNVSKEEFLTETDSDKLFKQFMDKFREGTQQKKYSQIDFYEDAIGTTLKIDKSLFQVADEITGKKTEEWKITKHNRQKYLLQLAEAITAPDEIWLEWYQADNGNYELRRRYLRWMTDSEGNEYCGIAVFGQTENEWTGKTLFPHKILTASEKENRTIEQIKNKRKKGQKYPEKQRTGLLLYKRSEKNE